MRHLKFLPLAAALFISQPAQAFQAGESPALGPNRTSHADIENHILTFFEIRKAGMKMFATPFNKLDGYGDGPVTPADTTSPGGRPTLQNNGTFLRINGLDSQTCMECHSVGSNATVPFTFALGGVGGSNNNAIFQPTDIDVDDSLGNGHAAFNGRYINPPFLFGAGGVELAGKEMTQDLQRWKHIAQQNPDRIINLNTKGVNFGTIVFGAQSNAFDYSNVTGVGDDLVVRPFGRKGEFVSTRAFDQGAMQFHMGMQPVEVVGAGVDGDNDGVVDEVLIGEMSALHIFATNMERPEVRDPNNVTAAGSALFASVGCAECHRPFLDTYRRVLPYSFPETDDNPFRDVYYSAALDVGPAEFAPNALGGVRVPLFSDLRTHDMGPGLAEDFGSVHDSQFITARLWGIADTAPYLHDGRALTLTDAINAHGGEAAGASANFGALSDPDKILLLDFLRTLRTPINPSLELF